MQKSTIFIALLLVAGGSALSLGEMLESVGNFFKDRLLEVSTVLTGLTSTVNGLQPILGDTIRPGLQLLTDLLNELKNESSCVGDQLEGITNRIVGMTVNAEVLVKQCLESAANNIAQEVEASIGNIVAMVKNKQQEAINCTPGNFGCIGHALAEFTISTLQVPGNVFDLLKSTVSMVPITENCIEKVGEDSYSTALEIADIISSCTHN